MKRVLCVFLALMLPLCADDVFCKDGKVHRGMVLRREAGILFGRSATPKDGQEQETVIVLNQVERVVFTEPAALREVRQAAYAGDARAVVEKNAQLIAEHRQWADVSGNYWRELMRAQVPALYALGENEELQKLVTAWIPTGDLDLDDCVRLLGLRPNGAEQGSFLELCKKATAGSPGTLVAAIGWLELGRDALAQKQWTVAVRHFLSVEVFASPWRLLLPEALLGAVRATAANAQPAQAAVYGRDLQSEYAHTPQAGKVAEALAAPPR
jgi:hypothetical protein